MHTHKYSSWRDWASIHGPYVVCFSFFLVMAILYLWSLVQWLKMTEYWIRLLSRHAQASDSDKRLPRGLWWRITLFWWRWRSSISSCPSTRFFRGPYVTTPGRTKTASTPPATTSHSATSRNLPRSSTTSKSCNHILVNVNKKNV